MKYLSVVKSNDEKNRMERITIEEAAMHANRHFGFLKPITAPGIANNRNGDAKKILFPGLKNISYITDNFGPLVPVAIPLVYSV
jgi:hypothetical protein